MKKDRRCVVCGAFSYGYKCLGCYTKKNGKVKENDFDR